MLSVSRCRHTCAIALTQQLACHRIFATALTPQHLWRHIHATAFTPQHSHSTCAAAYTQQHLCCCAHTAAFFRCSHAAASVSPLSRQFCAAPHTPQHFGFSGENPQQPVFRGFRVGRGGGSGRFLKRGVLGWGGGLLSTYIVVHIPERCVTAE